MNTIMLLSDESKIYATMGTIDSFVSANPNIIGASITSDHDGEKAVVRFYQYAIGSDIVTVDITLLTKIKPNIDDLYELLNENIEAFYEKTLEDVGYVAPINSANDEDTGITYSIEKQAIDNKIVKKGEKASTAYFTEIYFKSSVVGYYTKKNNITIDFKESTDPDTNDVVINEIRVVVPINSHNKSRNEVLMVMTGNKTQFDKFVVYQIKKTEKYKEVSLSMALFSDPVIKLSKKLDIEYIFRRK